MSDHILTFNAGSSSLKFAAYALGDRDRDPALALIGQVEKIGGDAHLSAKAHGETVADQAVPAADHAGATAAILRLIGERLHAAHIPAVGHRVVHGGPLYDRPVVVTDAIVDELARFNSFAPLHQPHNLAGIAAARAAFPAALQVACFDTAFHRAHPFVNDVFALPREYYDKGVRRYGFHGLSYEFITGHLAEVAPELAAGRIAVAHLGNGASMCAIRAGKSVGSTMGFTALDGLPMGTRCGQLDPGVLLYLMDQEGLSAAEISDLLFRRSGLLGLSGISNDMRTLEASDDPAAAQAIDYFVFRIRRELGAMAAIVGGLDAVVFTGGIGENSAFIRRSVCRDMDWLGLSIDEDANARNAPEFTAADSQVRVFALKTDEERVIARAAAALLAAAAA